MEPSCLWRIVTQTTVIFPISICLNRFLIIIEALLATRLSHGLLHSSLDDSRVFSTMLLSVSITAPRSAKGKGNKAERWGSWDKTMCSLLVNFPEQSETVVIVKGADLCIWPFDLSRKCTLFGTFVNGNGSHISRLYGSSLIFTFFFVSDCLLINHLLRWHFFFNFTACCEPLFLPVHIAAEQAFFLELGVIHHNQVISTLVGNHFNVIYFNRSLVYSRIVRASWK